MMRPMKLAGSELMFGEGCLEYIKTIKVEKVSKYCSRRKKYGKKWNACKSRRIFP